MIRWLLPPAFGRVRLDDPGTAERGVGTALSPKTVAREDFEPGATSPTGGKPCKHRFTRPCAVPRYGPCRRVPCLPVFIPPCLPTKAPRPPSGDAWLHEIKHDGFRVIARKDGPRVKLYSRPGNDLTDRFPLIVEGPGASALAVLLHRWRGRRLQRERPRIVRSHSSPRHR
jgi:hypothetical protein